MNELEESTTPARPNSWESEAVLTCAGPVWSPLFSLHLLFARFGAGEWDY